MDRLIHKLLDLYIKHYIKKHPAQIKKTEALGTGPKRFLLISSTALGDTLLSTPAIKSVRRSFPEADITLLVHKKVAPLFKDFSYIDRVLSYHGGYKKFFRTLQGIRRTRPDIVLIFHGNGPQDIALSVLSGAGLILKPPTQSPYRKCLSYNFEQKYQHTIEDRLDLVRAIGGSVIDTTMEIQAVQDKERAYAVKNLLGNHGLLIGFQIGAANSFKMWPVENFIALAKILLQNNGEVKIAVTGIAGEYRLAQKIREACGPRVINCCGKCSIDELPYLVKKMDVLITNDTGTMHLAIALKVPTISLFAPTDSNLSGPYQDLSLHKVIQIKGMPGQKVPKKLRNNEAMKLITPEEVFEQYESLMHNRSV